MKSWKTTLFGVLAACAGGCTQYPDPVVQKIASAVSAICIGLMGFFSKDHNVTGGKIQQ